MSLKPHLISPPIVNLADLVLTSNVRSPRPRIPPPGSAFPRPPQSSRRSPTLLARSTGPSASTSRQSADIDALSVAETSRKAARVFPAKKAYRFEQYAHIHKHGKMGLLFQHDNVTTDVWKKIRKAVAAIPVPAGAEEAVQLPTAVATGSSKGKKKDIPVVNNSEAIWPQGRANVLYVRTSVYRAMSKRASFGNKRAAKRSLEPWLAESTALISAPVLSPKYMDQILRACAKVLRENQKDDKVPKDKQPRLDLIVASVERKVVGKAEVERIRKMPELATLRAQTVGLLEGAGRQVVSLLTQAAGGSLVRTLQGLESSLKAKEEGGGTPP